MNKRREINVDKWAKRKAKRDKIKQEKNPNAKDIAVALGL